MAWCWETECSSGGGAGRRCSYSSACALSLYKQMLFSHFAFLQIVKTLFGCLSISENRYWCQSFIKVKWLMWTFEKQGIPVMQAKHIKGLTHIRFLVKWGSQPYEVPMKFLCSKMNIVLCISQRRWMAFVEARWPVDPSPYWYPKVDGGLKPTYVSPLLFFPFSQWWWVSRAAMVSQGALGLFQKHSPLLPFLWPKPWSLPT